MSATNDGGAAFPRSSDAHYNCPQKGMSLRDWFAGMALQGIWSQTKHEDDNHDLLSWRTDVYMHQASHCYEMADAMIEARREDA